MSAPAAPLVDSPSFAGAWRLVPGLVLTAVIAGAAVEGSTLAARWWPHLPPLSPMILSIVFGIGLNNTVGMPSWAKAGATFAMRRVLRFGIILLGLQLTFAQVAQVGITGVAIIATVLLATFVVTKQAARVIGVDARLAELIAAGTSICGASAVIATNTVTRAPDEDAAYAVACVTVFGSLAMVLYPLAPALLHLGPRAYGLWTGASIHEIAQVVAAAFQQGHQAGEFGTVAKLTRVMMLAPLVLGLGALAARRAKATGDTVSARPPLPWFVLGFIALVVVGSLWPISPALKPTVVGTTAFLLSMALAAMGLDTNFAKLKAKGVRPLMLGLFSWVFVAGFSLALVELFAR
jgi:uncharacterized integral membrane protein (TIGR00698 family)